MLTRGHIVHPYTPTSVGRVRHDGAVKVVVANNIPQTWAVARPGSSPEPRNAPFYINENNRPLFAFLRGGVMPLSMGRQHVEMDPSNPDTWQRQYSFSI